MRECMPMALIDVMRERWDQVHKFGRDAEHDDEHNADGEMAAAAAAYALGARSIYPWNNVEAVAEAPRSNRHKREAYVRAAALLIAEIQRLDRMER